MVKCLNLKMMRDKDRMCVDLSRLFIGPAISTTATVSVSMLDATEQDGWLVVWQRRGLFPQKLNITVC